MTTKLTEEQRELPLNFKQISFCNSHKQACTQIHLINMEMCDFTMKIEPMEGMYKASVTKSLQKCISTLIN